MKYVVVLGDGMADEPIARLNGRTPLAYANTPALDALSQKSDIGMVSTIPKEILFRTVPAGGPEHRGTDEGHGHRHEMQYRDPF